MCAVGGSAVYGVSWDVDEELWSERQDFVSRQWEGGGSQEGRGMTHA